MNKRLLTCIILTGLLILLGCSKAKYDDFIEVNTKYIEAMDAYLSSLESAGDAGSVADAIETFAERMDVLAPEMKELRGKYVEWQDKSKMPKELKPLSEKAEQVAKRLPQTFMKSMQYMKDPRVAAAMEKLQSAMMKMQ